MSILTQTAWRHAWKNNLFCSLFCCTEGNLSCHSLQLSHPKLCVGTLPCFLQPQQWLLTRAGWRSLSFAAMDSTLRCIAASARRAWLGPGVLPRFLLSCHGSSSPHNGEEPSQKIHFLPGAGVLAQGPLPLPAWTAQWHAGHSGNFLQGKLLLGHAGERGNTKEENGTLAYGEKQPAHDQARWGVAS